VCCKLCWKIARLFDKFDIHRSMHCNYIPKYNQQDATLLDFIYFCKVLYMFQAVFLLIIRNAKLYIQLQVFVRP